MQKSILALSLIQNTLNYYKKEKKCLAGLFIYLNQKWKLQNSKINNGDFTSAEWLK